MINHKRRENNHPLTRQVASGLVRCSVCVEKAELQFFCFSSTFLDFFTEIANLSKCLYVTLPSICFFLFLFRSESEDELLSSTHLDKASGKLLFLKILRNKTKIKTLPTKQAFPKRKKTHLLRSIGGPDAKRAHNATTRRGSARLISRQNRLGNNGP